MSISTSNIKARGPDFGHDDPIGKSNTDPSTRYSDRTGWALAGVGIGLVVFGSVFMSAFKPHPSPNPKPRSSGTGTTRNFEKSSAFLPSDAHRVGSPRSQA